MQKVESKFQTTAEGHKPGTAYELAAIEYQVHEELDELQSPSDSGKHRLLELQPISVSGQQADAASVQQRFASFQLQQHQQQFTDDQSPDSHTPSELAKSVEPPAWTKLDVFVRALVVTAIVVFTVFQIKACADDYAVPLIKSENKVMNRTFPGIMICPYTDTQADAFNAIVQRRNDFPLILYESNAILSSSIRDLVLVFNTNFDAVSKSTRKPHSCKFLDDVNDQFLPVPYKYVTVKNSGAISLTDLQNNNVCLDATCDSLVANRGVVFSSTAPNVECMVFDPSFFEGASQTCNPMKEVHPNTLDSIEMALQQSIPFSFNVSGVLRLNLNYTGISSSFGANVYLFPPGNPSVDSLNLSFVTGINSPPIPLSPTPEDLLFSGLVAVIYDAALGIPEVLDFSGVAYDQMSHDIDSRIVLRRQCESVNASGCWMQRINRVVALATLQVEYSFENEITGKLKNETFEGIFIQPAEFLPGDDVVLEVSFASPSTLVLNPTITLTILSIASLIFSTSVALWGLQENIKLSIIQVSTKLKLLWTKVCCMVLVPKFNPNTHPQCSIAEESKLLPSQSHVSDTSFPPSSHARSSVARSAAELMAHGVDYGQELQGLAHVTDSNAEENVSIHQRVSQLEATVHALNQELSRLRVNPGSSGERGARDRSASNLPYISAAAASDQEAGAFLTLAANNATLPHQKDDGIDDALQPTEKLHASDQLLASILEMPHP
jgi:hypothetical protein